MKATLAILFGVIMFSFYSLQAQTNNPWEVPKKYSKKVNPIEADESSLLEGNELYQANCISCHGEKGTGNGEMAKQLNVDPSDFTLDDMDVQTDGDLFYKIKFGNEDMHAFEKKLTDDKIWNIVNYIRTFYQDK